MKAKFLYADMKGHAMVGEILKETNMKSKDNAPYLIVRILIVENRIDVNLIDKKLSVPKDKCELGDFNYV